MEKFWETVRSSDYYRSVLGNMGGPTKGNAVRFGVEGEGIAPNYQVEYANGEVVAFRGLSHSPNTETQRYAEQNLSGKYEYLQVQELLAECLQTRRK